MRTFTINIPKVDGRAKVIPVKINGSVMVGKGKEDRVSYNMDIPVGQDVTGVPEPVAKFVYAKYTDIKVTEEGNAPAKPISAPQVQKQTPPAPPAPETPGQGEGEKDKE